MSERSERISKLLDSQKSRASYIRAKLGVLVPSQIRALRMKSTNPPLPRQKDLARETDMQQSRISMFETPGAANVTLETLANIAAGLKVGLIVKFVSFSEMLSWENKYSQDKFNVTRIESDQKFLNPSIAAPPVTGVSYPLVYRPPQVPKAPINPELLVGTPTPAPPRRIRKEWSDLVDTGGGIESAMNPVPYGLLQGKGAPNPNQVRP